MYNAKRHNANRRNAERHNTKAKALRRIETSCVLGGQIISVLKGSRLIVQVERKHYLFRSHFLPGVIAQ